MARSYFDRTSRAESNVILDSILTYYTDMSNRQAQNDDNQSCATVSTTQLQNDNNSPIGTMNPMAIKDIGEFPLPPHTVHTTPKKSSTAKLQNVTPFPKYQATNKLQKTSADSQSLAKSIQSSPNTKTRRTSLHLLRTATSRSANSKPDHALQSVISEEYQQPLVESPTTDIQNSNSQTCEEGPVLNNFVKKSATKRHKTIREKNLDSRQDFVKGPLTSAKNEAFMTVIPSIQQTLSYDGSISSAGQSPYSPDSFDFPFEDITETAQIDKSSSRQKHQLTSSCSSSSNHEDSLYSFLRRKSLSRNSSHPVEDSTHRHATSPVLGRYGLLQKQSSEYRITHTNVATLSDMVSFPFPAATLKPSSRASDDSIPNFSRCSLERPGSSRRDFNGSEGHRSRISQDLPLRPSSQFKVNATAPDYISRMEVLQRERSTGARQGLPAGELPKIRDVCANTRETLSRHGSVTESQHQALLRREGSIKRRHASALLLSPQPQRLLSSIFCREESKLSLFEERSKRDPESEDLVQSSSPNSEEMDILLTYQDDIQGPKGKEDERSSTQGNSHTPYDAKTTWPLPSYRIDQGSTRHRACTQPSQPFWKWDAHEDSELRPHSSEKRLPALPRGSIGRMESSHVQQTIAGVDLNQTRTISKLRSNSEPRFVRTLKHQKSLPALPEDLDTSAIATFPLSREVPLPEFTIAKTAGKRHTCKIATSSNSLPSSRKPSWTPASDNKNVESASIPPEQSTIITDEEEPLSMANNRTSQEQSIQDACVIYSDNAETDDHRHQHRWSTSSWGAAAKSSSEDKVDELQQVRKKGKQKTLKGCGSPWTRFWRSLSCSAPERNVTISRSSMKTS